jgi:hypothetical protein
MFEHRITTKTQGSAAGVPLLDDPVEFTHWTLKVSAADTQTDPMVSKDVTAT